MGMFFPKQTSDERTFMIRPTDYRNSGIRTTKPEEKTQPKEWLSSRSFNVYK
jgi:hypothetical protein